MKKVLVAAVLTCMAGAGAMAAMGDLVSSFANTGTSTHYGLAADANYLYSYHYTSPYYIYIINKNTGSAVGSYSCPLGTSSPNYYLRGVSYEPPGYLWAVNYSMQIAAKWVASSGSLVSSFATDSARYGICAVSNGSSAATGIYTSYYTGTFWSHNTAGSVLSSFALGSSCYNYDLAWDYGNNLLWYGNYSADTIIGMTTAGSVVASWPCSGSSLNPYGVAYYGNYLYVATTSGTPDEYIWVYHCPNTVGVAPSSLGRVKAIYK